MMLATTPLSQLPLVLLDLETTGLTPARDRIVQIVAITIKSPAQHFDMLVNPGVMKACWRQIRIMPLSMQMLARKNKRQHSIGLKLWASMYQIFLMWPAFPVVRAGSCRKIQTGASQSPVGANPSAIGCVEPA